MAQETSKPITTRGREVLPDGTVRCWSEVGATLPIPDTYGSIRFLFGHERISPSSAQEDIIRTEALVDEFNEKVLEKKLRKYRRLFNQLMLEVPEAKTKKSEKPSGSVQARAQKRMKKGKKK